MTDFTIADVLAWARTKPAGEEYNFCKPSDCAVAQFGRATGRQYLIGVADLRDIDLGLWEAAILFPMTFGAFVSRLQALCPEAPAAQSAWAAIDAYLTDIDAVSADKLAPAHIQPHTV